MTEARILEIAARPTPLSIRTDRTAVVVVDMQNDFASPGGMSSARVPDIAVTAIFSIAPFANTNAIVVRSVVAVPFGL